MTCRSLPPFDEGAIVDVARGRDVGANTIAAVQSHVEQCEACAARLARERRLSEGLRALAEATADAAPSAALEERLMAAVAAEQTSALPVWIAPVVAAAAIVVALVWWRPSTTPPVHSSSSAAPEKPVERAAGPATMTSAPASAAPRVTAGSGAQRPRGVARRPAPAGDAGFITLPAAIGLPDFESGVIVRLELPQAALPAYGLEIVPQSKTPVQADLLIGQDGQARAIRLVNRSITRSGAEQ